MTDDTIQALLRKRLTDPAIAVKYADAQWSWRQYLTGATARASALIAAADPQRPMHVGVLLGNTPEMLRTMAAAGLGGYVLCGSTPPGAARHWPPTSGGRSVSSS